MMNAQTIQDNVNKYRFGVLVGNFNEEIYGSDLAARQRVEKYPNTSQKDHYSLYSTVLNQQKDNSTQEEKEYKEHVVKNNRGVQNQLLVGHGVRQDDFEKPHYGTTYDLSFNQKVKPQVQVWSKFDAGTQTTQKQFHKDQIYEKGYQKDIVPLGTQVQRTQKPFKPYAEYTKTFDATYQNIPLRK